MDVSLESRIACWDGLGVVCRRHRPTGTWIFIALHDDSLGTPTGGTRMRVYGSPTEGLRDAMRLAAGMTHKWAALDFPFGGGKAVLAQERELEAPEREDVLACYGKLLGSLRDAFSTGEDLGTSPADMLVVARYTASVHGVDRERGVARDPGPFTAEGVLAAVRATVARRFGTRELTGRSVLVQGLGRAGGPLARLLAGEGARLLLADVDTGRVETLAGELGAEVVDAGRVYDTECDVYAPCAVGGTLDEATIPRLRCAAVAGSANNQLDRPADADALHERGVLYAPDYIANAGGALAFGSIHQGVTGDDELHRRVRGIETTLDELFEEAGRRGESPLHAAQRRVEGVLERARAASR